MSISVYCQWCGAANNTAGRCTDMMCRGGDARPAVVEVGSDPVGDSYRTRMVKDWEPGGTIDQLRIEIAALRARVAALEAVERAAREYRRLMRFCMESPDSTRQDEEDRDVAEDALDAALAALGVPRG